MISLQNQNQEIVGYTLISPEDYKIIGNLKGFLTKGYPTVYYNGKCIEIHKLIYVEFQKQLIPDGYVIDHKNRNKLDNRRENLRIVTRKMNGQNKSKVAGSSSEYFGVLFDTTYLHYVAFITISGEQIRIGTFQSEIEAAEEHDIYIVHHEQFNELGHPLNFPDQIEEFKLRIPHKKYQKEIPYHGVYKNGNRYMVTVFVNGKSKYVGWDKDMLVCAKMYDAYIMKHNIRQELNFNYPDYVPPPKPVKILGEKIDETTIRLLKKTKTGRDVLIDIDDYEKIKYYSLYYTIHKDGYEHVDIRVNKGQRQKNLARYLMDETDPKIFIDHIDTNSLNYKRSNLRRTDSSVNGNNRKKRKGTSSKYQFVFRTKRGKYAARIKYRSKVCFSKQYDTELEAGKAVNAYISEYLPNSGKRLNIIEDDNTTQLKKQK